MACLQEIKTDIENISTALDNNDIEGIINFISAWHLDLRYGNRIKLVNHLVSLIVAELTEYAKNNEGVLKVRYKGDYDIEKTDLYKIKDGQLMTPLFSGWCPATEQSIHKLVRAYRYIKEKQCKSEEL